MFDGIIDISHFQGLNLNLEQMAAAGFASVIAKATQGASFVDPAFAHNRAEADRCGLLFGAYAFGTAGDGEAQAAFFLRTVNPKPIDLVALDFEGDGQDTMRLEDAADFVAYIQGQLGRYPVLYGGGYLKMLLRNGADPLLSQCPLWLSEYGPHALLPPGWNKYTLWQFSDGAHNAPPEFVPGIGVCDRDRFAGTREELAAAWPF